MTTTTKRAWRTITRARRFPAHAFQENSPGKCAVCGEALRHPIHRWQTPDGPVER